VASAIKVSFAQLYRSAFAENDPQIKQQLLRQVQSLIDTWHFEEKNQHLRQQTNSEASSDVRPFAS
jgi:hypothetical protein